VCTPLREVGGEKRSIFARIELSRRARPASRIIAAAAICALTACGLVPLPDAPDFPGGHVDTELRTPIDSPAGLSVAGERLNITLLNRFYARHGFEPVWADRPTQTRSLTDAVLRAGDQGLDPGMFHARLLRHATNLPPLDRDLLLSDAFLSYADALARGAMPIERRSDDEILAPAPVDVAAALDAALASPDPGASLEALAPATPTYIALRQALRKSRSGAASDHLRTIVVNLERQRWLPRSLPPDRAWVNVADQQLELYRDDRPVFSTRVVVGEDVRHNQTPEFSAAIDASFFNPPWVIPADIVTAEILPKIRHDPKYLAQNNMIMLAGGEAEQLPGPTAGLGLLMFDMPNRFDVYLHDTPERNIFNRENRRISHGCIRVQNPRDFAALLLQQPIDRINHAIAAGGTTRHALPTPMPVFVVYETAFLGTNGTLEFRPDFYQRDAEIWRALGGADQSRDTKVQTVKRPTASCARRSERHANSCART
jgi:murein L,D-transpeptidase YcbB/YkuD